MNNLVKKAIAECIGTFVLVFFACGTAAVGADWSAVALSFGFVIVAMAYSIGRISGCHINPAVSLGCLITKRMTVKEFLVYVAAQFVGGILGAIALFGILKMSGIDFKAIFVAPGDACNNFVGGYKKANGDMNVGGMFGAILAEVILTCVFVYVILNVTASKNKAVSKIAGIIIGLTLTLVHLVGIGLTGTSVNPARSFATALTQAMFFDSTDALAQVWVFILAPLAGGALAAVLYKVLHKDDEEGVSLEKTEAAEDEKVEE
ncbi:MAG: aquaporin [Acholeplasmatales bacterium]|nr:aquaporin [Acholeplasmatales bacterium]